ncbi:MAG: tyrosine-type recombinase/integrase [Candidatus Micrarchaeia archaeon]
MELKSKVWKENAENNTQNNTQKEEGTKKQKWDRGLDYEETYKELINFYIYSRKKTSRLYTLILLLQLRNGSRILEAVRGFKEWVKNNGKEDTVYIKVAKKKKEEYRAMVVPKEFKALTQDTINSFKWVLEIDDYNMAERLRSFTKYNFKFNTHSLRYAYITYLLKKGTNPAIVAKIIHHANLTCLLNYVQHKEADETLKKQGDI